MSNAKATSNLQPAGFVRMRPSQPYGTEGHALGEAGSGGKPVADPRGFELLLAAEPSNDRLGESGSVALTPDLSPPGTGVDPRQAIRDASAAINAPTDWMAAEFEGTLELAFTSLVLSEPALSPSETGDEVAIDPDSPTLDAAIADANWTVPVAPLPQAQVQPQSQPQSQSESLAATFADRSPLPQKLSNVAATNAAVFTEEMPPSTSGVEILTVEQATYRFPDAVAHRGATRSAWSRVASDLTAGEGIVPESLPGELTETTLLPSDTVLIRADRAMSHKPHGANAFPGPMAPAASADQLIERLMGRSSSAMSAEVAGQVEQIKGATAAPADPEISQQLSNAVLSNLGDAAGGEFVAAAEPKSSAASFYAAASESEYSGSLPSLLKTLSVTLAPEGLGRVSLTLELYGSQLGVAMEAENGTTARLIEHQLAELGDRLSGAGYDVHELSVSQAALGDQVMGEGGGAGNTDTSTGSGQPGQGGQSSARQAGHDATGRQHSQLQSEDTRSSAPFDGETELGSELSSGRRSGIYI